MESSLDSSESVQAQKISIMSEDNTTTCSKQLSALQENIENKGKNAYYFAHTNTPTGPKWDGKPQPRLLAKHSSVGTTDNVLTGSDGEAHITNEEAQSLLKSLKHKKSSFDYSLSNISKYAFLDDGLKIRIYIEMKGVGEACTKEGDITLDWNERSFRFVVRNYKSEGVNEESKEESGVKCLSFGRLQGPIKKASFKKKPDRIIITLWKAVEEGMEPVEWKAIGGARNDDDSD